MKYNPVSGDDRIYRLLFLIIALITFYPLFFTGLGTADDLYYYLLARNGEVMEGASFFARVAGRFYFYIVMPVYSLPYIVDNMVVVKLFQFIPLFLCFLLFARIIFVTTKSKELAWLFLLTFLFTMQISRHTSLFLAYPFYFTFSFSMLMAAFLYMIRCLERKKMSRIWFAALLFLTGLLFYESYLLFVLFFAITIVYYNYRDMKSWKEVARSSFFQFLPFMVAGVLYLSVYFIFRYYHPSQYTGTSFGMKSVSAGSFFNVLWQFSTSAFPLNIYESTHNLFWEKSELVSGYSPVVLNLLLSARVEWILKGILVSWLGYRLLLMTSTMKLGRFLGGVIIAVLLIFIPHVPLALTEKYTYYAEHGQMFGYVTTFFSFFGTLLFITLCLGFAINLFNFSRHVKTGVAVLLVSGFFICSVLTDFSNHSIARDVRSANLRFYAIDELLKTEEFRNVPDSTPFYGKTLWDNPSYAAAGLTEQDFNWFKYFRAKTGRTFAVGRDDKVFIEYSRRVAPAPYFLSARQAEKTEDVLLVMAKMNQVMPQDSTVIHFADLATVLYYSPYKTFTLSFRTRGDGSGGGVTVKINHIAEEIAPDKTIEITICKTKKGFPATIFNLQCEGIDLNSVMVSNMVNRNNKIFYL